MSEQKAIQGLVFVYLEAGPNIKEDDLNDWYDNEHAPRRLTVPGYMMAARYKAADSQAPTWLTLADIETPEITSSPEYEALGTLGSENEKTIISKLQGVSRRTYTLLRTTVHPETSPEALPGKYVLVVSFEIAPENEDDFNKWYDEEHMDLVARVPGWKRGRRYKLVDSKQSGQADELVSKYLIVHELDNGDFEPTAEFKYPTSTDWAKRVIGSAIRLEVRKFELHKVFTRP
ncbi:hypothetical protein DFH09DRAFT_1248501 [Mycena vulgaris]|nr:hypothetical protein DFH09DRAFT_1248501 [Mycena vulgaris]